MKDTLATISIGVAALAGGGLIYDNSIPLADLNCEETQTKVSIVESLKDEKVRDGLLQYRELSQDEKGTIKGCEVAKVTQALIGRYVDEKLGIEVDIQRIEPIEGGYQVFARAWKGKTQLGFGADGSIEIERFRFFNPPVLVDDPAGSIIVPSFYDDVTDQTVPERRLREDPVEAFKQALFQTISIVGKTNTKIKYGSVGNTTSTFYTGAGDGYVQRVNQASWTAARDTADGVDVDYTSASALVIGEEEFVGNFNIFRVFLPFDTSAIPDSDTISSATLSVWPTSGSGERLIGVIQTSQSSNTTLAVGDFDALTVNGATEGATRTYLTTTGAYTNYTLNASGIGWISKTGFSKFGLRNSDDLDNVDPAAVRDYTFVSTSEETGTTQDPKLVVEHASAGGGGETTPQNIIIFE